MVLVKSSAPRRTGRRQGSDRAAFVLTLPDGKFLVADSLLPFGSKPFQAIAKFCRQGPPGRPGRPFQRLEILEFSDLNARTARKRSPPSPNCWRITPALTLSIRISL